MAISTWVGTTDTDFGTAGNWTGGLPETGDIAYVPPGATVNIAGSDETAAPIDEFVVAPGCTITIGTEGTPLQLSFDSQTNGVTTLEGTGVTYLELTEPQKVYIRAAGAAPSTGKWATNITTGDSADAECYLYVNCDSSESVSIGANSGETCEIRYLNIAGGDVAVGENVTSIGGTPACTMIINGGDVDTYCPLVNAVQNDGEWRHHEGALTNAAISGGRCELLTDDTAAAISVSLGGELDLDKSLVTKTITSLTLAPPAIIRNKYKTWAGTVGFASGAVITAE